MPDVKQEVTEAPPPITDRDSDPWWAALYAGHLKLPRCLDCGSTWFPVTPGCPECGGIHVELVASTGRGHLYSWVVINRALGQSMSADAPYTIVAVDTEEGARMFGRLFAPSDQPMRAGEPLSAVIRTLHGQTVVGFERAIS